MHDSEPSLLPPNSGNFTPSTPSGLTPNTRSEAEAALAFNTVAQTDSAAPTTPLATDATRNMMESHRPGGTSSANYEKALLEARKQSSVSSTLSTDTTDGTSEVDAIKGVPLPRPGQGVVPLHTGPPMGQAEAVKRAKPTGLSLAALGRQPSWSEQDMKHIYSANLMAEPKDAGYSSGVDDKGVGPKE